MTLKFPIIDITDRADGTHIYWDAAAGIHKYEAPPEGAGGATAVSVYRDAALALGAGSTAIAWDTEERDDGDLWEGVTNPSRITIPTTGWYLVGGKAGAVTNNDQTEVILKKNGTTDIDKAQIYQATNTVEYYTVAARLHYFTAADYVEMYVSTGAANALRVGQTTLNMWAVKIG